jgi:hypothetical protein
LQPKIAEKQRRTKGAWDPDVAARLAQQKVPPAPPPASAQPPAAVEVIDQASISKAELRATLQEFYTKYHPDGLANVESLVAKYWSTWRKRKLIESLHDKYADAIRIKMEASMATGRVHANPPGEASYTAPAIADNDLYVYVSSKNEREDEGARVLGC